MADLGGMYAALMGQFGQDAARTVAVNQAGLDRVADSGNQLVQAIRAGRARMDALKQQERENAMKDRAMSLEEQLGGARIGLMGAQTEGLRGEEARAKDKQPLTLQDLRAGIKQKEAMTEGTESDNRVKKATEGQRIDKAGLENVLLGASADAQRAATAEHQTRTEGQKITNKFLPQSIQSEINARDASAAASRAAAGLSGAHAQMVQEQLKQLKENGDPKSFGVVMKSYEDLLAAWKAEGAIAAQTGMPFSKPMPTADDARDHLANLRGENKAFHNGQPFSFDSEIPTPIGNGKVFKDGAGNGLLIAPNGVKRFIPAAMLAKSASSNSPQGLPDSARPSPVQQVPQPKPYDQTRGLSIFRGQGGIFGDPGPDDPNAAPVWSFLPPKG